MADDDAAVLETLEVRVPVNRHMIRQWAMGAIDDVTLLVMPRFLQQAAERWVEANDA